MKKRNIIFLVFMMVVGFAGVSAALVVNGTFNLSFDETGFIEDVVFTWASTADGTAAISPNEKNISFETNKLENVNDIAVLDFEIANKNTQYNATVEVNCGLKNNFSSFDEYISITTNLARTFDLESGKSKSGELTIKLKKAYPGEEVAPEINCKLTPTPVSRSTVGDEYIEEPFSKAGILRATTYEDATGFWEYRDQITKVVFENEMIEHTTTDDLIFDANDENSEYPVKAYLVPNEQDATTHTLYIQSRTGVKANENSSYLFYNFRKLESIKGLEYFNTSQVTNMSSMFYLCSSLTSLDLSNFDTSQVTNMSSMFYNCSGLTSLDISSFNTNQVTNMIAMFACCSGLTSLDLNSFNTGQVTDMSSMFSVCEKLTSLNVSSFNTGQVTNMSNMFFKCYNLKSLDVSNFNTSQVTSMSFMFSDCRNLTSLDLSNFNTGQVTYMRNMFLNCTKLASLDVSSFNTSQVTYIDSMFYNCSSLTSLDLSNFDTSKVRSMDSMFSSCSSLMSLDVSNFNTSQVTDMGGMFRSCSSLKNLDLSNFDTSKVTDMSYMFYKCAALSTTFLLNPPNYCSYTRMFEEAATESGAQIIVYTATTKAEEMVSKTKSENSNIVTQPWA